jgi:SAM-dependent methyltransferase
MNRVRAYLPLISFVVPTLIVSYGIVIPRSCIAGINELTIGFGTTIVGAVFTYIAGQRVVMQPQACQAPPMRARLLRALNRQASSPSGLFGHLLGLIWRREHARLNAEVLSQLDVQAGHDVLEVGCGPGEAMHEARRHAVDGRIVGVDISELMVGLARARNREAVARGQLEVHLGDIASLPLGEATFERIFSVHSIYFWRDVDGVLAKLAAALKPGGKLLLAFRPEGDDVPARFREPTYRFPHENRVIEVMQGLGLSVLSSKRSTSSPAVVLLALSKPSELRPSAHGS